MPMWSRKRKSRPRAAFFVECALLTFRVLLAPPRLVQADLLSLHFARIARHQAGRAQLTLQPGIILDQRTGDAVTYCTRLPALAAAIDVHEDVEARAALRQLQRLAHHHAAGFAAEELVDRLAVHHEVAFAWLDENSRDRAFAPPGAVVVIANHLSDLQCLRLL